MCKDKAFVSSKNTGYQDPTYNSKAGYPKPGEVWAFDAKGNIDKKKSAELSKKLGDWSTVALGLVIPVTTEEVLAGLLVKVTGKVAIKYMPKAVLNLGPKAVSKIQTLISKLKKKEAGPKYVKFNIQHFAKKEVNWTNHGYKHYPAKNAPWKDIIKSTKKGPAKYKSGIDIEKLEREAWATGQRVTNGKTWKVKKYETSMGASGGKETKYLRIEESAGTIHGHPITEAEYNKLLK